MVSPRRTTSGFSGEIRFSYISSPFIVYFNPTLCAGFWAEWRRTSPDIMNRFVVVDQEHWTVDRTHIPRDTVVLAKRRWLAVDFTQRKWYAGKSTTFNKAITLIFHMAVGKWINRKSRKRAGLRIFHAEARAALQKSGVVIAGQHVAEEDEDEDDEEAVDVADTIEKSTIDVALPGEEDDEDGEFDEVDEDDEYNRYNEDDYKLPDSPMMDTPTEQVDGRVAAEDEGDEYDYVSWAEQVLRE